jgi:response regulator RpfG family c-di-GMP phosphodiesterase
VTETAHDDLLRRTIAVLDALPCGALLLARDGRIVHVNPALGRLGQRPPTDFVGLNLRQVYPPGAGGEELVPFFEDFETPRETEFFLPLSDGRRLPVVIAGSPLCSGDKPAQYRLVTLIDISELKAAQEHVREQYREVARLSDTVLDQALVLKRHARILEKRVQQRTRELHEANMDAIYMLAVASEAKDADTGAHVLRIRDYSRALARAIGWEEDQAERVAYSAILHDVGKMQVPDEILKKPGPLTPPERETIETHTVAGERILSAKPFFELARQIARSHHECWDGSGYPDGLRGEAIPPAARVVHLADVFDALASKRPYKEPWPPGQVRRAIEDGAGTLFEPALVGAFVRLADSGEWARIERRAEA